MISLLRNHCLTKNLLFNPCFLFSSRQAIDFHKAKLASQIIETIRNSPLNEYRSDTYPSLTEKILDKIQQYQVKNDDGSEDGETKKTVEKEMGKYFTEGVWVPSDMCSQKGFQGPMKSYEEVKSLNEEVEVNAEEMEEEDLRELKFRRLKFCPTYLITGQIFRSLHIRKDNYHFHIGPRGSGKTHSILLYVLLSEIIFRYRHKYFKGKNDDTDFPKDINFKIYKIIYWSLHINKQRQKWDIKEEMNDLIIRQCYELKDIWACKNIYTIGSRGCQSGLQGTYRKLNIRPIIVNDHLNEAADVEKRQQIAVDNRKKYYQKFFKESSKEQQSQQQSKVQIVSAKASNPVSAQQMKKNHRTKMDKLDQEVQHTSLHSDILYKKVRPMIWRLSKLTSDKHYISSGFIEKQALSKISVTADSRKNPIQDYLRQMSYPMRLYGNLAICDAIEHFILQLRFLWENNQLKDASKVSLDQKEDQLEKIKKALNKILRQKVFAIISPAQFKEAIAQNFSEEFSQSALSLLSEEDLYIKLERVLEEIQQKQVDETVAKLKQIVDKIQHDKNNRLQLLIRLWRQAEYRCKNLPQQHMPLPQVIAHEANQPSSRLKSHQIGFTLSHDGLFYQLQYKYSKLQLSIFSQVFMIGNDIYPSQRDTLYSHVNPVILLLAFRAFRRDFYGYVLEASKSSEDTFDLLAKEWKTLVVDLLTTILSKQKTEFHYFCQRIGKQPQHQSMEFFSPLVFCFQPAPISYPTKDQNYEFLPNIASHLQKMSKLTGRHNTTPSKSFLFLPVLKSFIPDSEQIVKQGINNDHHVQDGNNLIDFFTVSIHGDFVFVNAFGVAGQNNQQQKFSQLFTFLQQFNHWKDKHQCKLNLQRQQRQYDIHLNYNLITRHSFDGDYQNLIQKKITQLTLVKPSKKSPNNHAHQTLSAINSFTYKNHHGAFVIKSETKPVFLKELRIISLADLYVRNPDDEKISVEKKMLEKIVIKLRVLNSWRDRFS